jgi:AT-rich DNA-binding protein
MKKKLPKATARRMAEYYRQFLRLQEQGVEVINSFELEKYIKIEATTIRRDFSYIGDLGKQRVGYNVAKVVDELQRVLGLQEPKKVILIGAGHLGTALFNFNYIKGNNIYITECYESDVTRIGVKIGDVTIRNIADLETSVASDVYAAILAVPSSQTQKVADRLVALGFKGFLNFSQDRINVPKDVTVENIDLANSLQTLMYLVDTKMHEKK